MLRRRRMGRDGPQAAGTLAGDSGLVSADELGEGAERRYRGLVEGVPTVIYERELGDDAPWNYVGPRLVQLCGYTAEEWVADPGLWVSRLHPSDRERVVSAHRSARPGDVVAIEYRLRHRHGREIWVHDEAELIVEEDCAPCLRGALSDVSPLRALAQLHQDLVEGLPAVTYQAEAGAEGRWLYVSPQIERLLGYTAEEWMADPGLWASRLHPADRKQIVSKDQVFRDGGSAPDEEAWEYRLLHRDDHPVWIRDEGRLYQNPAGWPPLWRGVLIDITGERAAQHEASAAAERYRSLVELLPAVFYRSKSEAEGGGHYVSPQVEDLLGYSPEEMSANPELWVEAIHPEDRERVVTEKQQAWTSAPGTRLTLEYRVVHRDGQVARVRDQSILNLSDEGPRVDGLIFDVSAAADGESSGN
jgi:PAS domain S-box-containing protein